MIQFAITINPPTYQIGNQGDSNSFLVSTLIFKNKKYGVEGRKFGMDSMYWEVEELGCVITSNNSTIIFSNNELNTYEMNQIFTMWHTTGISLKN
jgi:hypothetical protein